MIYFFIVSLIFSIKKCDSELLEYVTSDMIDIGDYSFDGTTPINLNTLSGDIG